MTQKQAETIARELDRLRREMDRAYRKEDAYEKEGDTEKARAAEYRGDLLAVREDGIAFVLEELGYLDTVLAYMFKR